MLIAFIGFLALSASAHNSSCLAVLEGAAPVSPRVNGSQRSLALAVELSKLREPEAQPIVNADGRTHLTTLSQANLERWLREIERLWPTPISPNAAAMASELEFLGLAPLEPQLEFYSQLTEGNTQGFTWVATQKAAPLMNLHGLVATDSRRLKTDFGDQFALVLPHFRDARSMIKFFAQWDPDSLSLVVRQNRYNLPKSAWNLEGFLALVESADLSLIFPDDQLYRRLAPLRQKLHRFALTSADARRLAQAAFARYWSTHDPRNNWNLSGGAGSMMNTTFTALGLDGLSLRVPLGVPNAETFIVRRAETQLLALPDHSRRAQPPRLDHSTMP